MDLTGRTKWIGGALVALTAMATLGLAGCDPGKKSDDAPHTGAPDNGSGAPDGGDGAGQNKGEGASKKPPGNGGGDNAQGGSGGGSVTPAEAHYSAMGGDTYTLATHTRTWSAPTAEPSAWKDLPDGKYEVIGLYASGLHCKYRISQSTTSTPAYAYDVGCDTDLQCGTTNCTEKNVDAIDVGDFKQASGKEQRCSSVAQSAAGDVLYTTVTRTWRHKDALRDGEIVKTDSLQCGLPLKAGDDAAHLDACAAPADRVVTFSHTESTLTAQTHGAGKPELKDEAAGAFKPDGAFKEPANAKLSSVGCVLAAGKLSVSVTKAYCTDAKKLATYSLSLSGLPVPSANSAPTAPYMATVQASEGGTFFAKSAGGCSVTYHGDHDKGMLFGSATCNDGAFAAQSGPSTESVGGVSFSCFAPTGFFQ